MNDINILSQDHSIEPADLNPHGPYNGSSVAETYPSQQQDPTLFPNQAVTFQNSYDVKAQQQSITLQEDLGTLSTHGIVNLHFNEEAHLADLERHDPRKYIQDHLGPLLQKELGMFYMERQRGLQRMFAPENLSKRLDQIFDKDLIVKKLLSDVEAEGNLAFERVSQQLRQFVNIEQERKIEKQAKHILELQGLNAN